MRANEFIIEKKKGKDGKACWSGYRYNGTKNGKDDCVKVREFTELEIAVMEGGHELQVDEKTDPALCRSPKRLGRSDHSSCVSQGLRPHNSKGKGHTDGHGNYLKGKKAKSVHYGGNVKDYDGK